MDNKELIKLAKEGVNSPTFKDVKDQIFPENRIILCGYRGSIAHGTYVPNHDPNSIDDVDLITVYFAPKEHYIGLGRGKKYDKGRDAFVDCWDVVNYEFRKFINLLLKANPNVLSFLWLRTEHYFKNDDIFYDYWGKMLIDVREAFLSKRVYHTFTGYAHGQLHKMEHYAFKGYMGEKRKKLVEKFGYDAKNASHLIRLLTMCIEILEGGVVIPYRETDSHTFIDIKQGKWGLDRVKEYADYLFEVAKTSRNHTDLPDEPDYKKVEEFLMDALYTYLRRGGE